MTKKILLTITTLIALMLCATLVGCLMGYDIETMREQAKENAEKNEDNICPECGLADCCDNDPCDCLDLVDDDKVTVTFNTGEGGSSVHSVPVTIGDKVAKPSPGPTRPGFKFDGWVTVAGGDTAFDFENTVITQPTTIYARWVFSHYLVHFDTGGGTEVESEPVEAGEKATRPATNPTRTGYTFLDWVTTQGGSTFFGFEDTPINEDTTIYAAWKAHAYTVNYDANASSTDGGTASGTTTSTNHTYDIESTLAINAFSITGTSAQQYFLNWNVAADGSGTRYSSGARVLNLTSDDGAAITLYAIWTADIIRTVTFDTGSFGNIVDQDYVVDGGYAQIPQIIPTTSQTGYVFDKWVTTSGGTVEFDFHDTPINSDITIYAAWKPITYNVAYNASPGGAWGSNPSGAMANTQHTYGQPMNLRTNAFSYAGYDFDGWAVTPGGAKVYDDGALVSNLAATEGAVVTLYARWVPITYTVAYNAGTGGTGNMANTELTYNTYASLRPNTFTNAGGSFIGWATEPGGAKVYDDNESVLNLASTQGATVTLYAVWSSITYFVRYHPGAAEGPYQYQQSGDMNDSEHTVGVSKALSLNVFSYGPVYQFLGWATAVDGDVVYTDGQLITGNEFWPIPTQGAVVTLYAVWEFTSLEYPVLIQPDPPPAGWIVYALDTEVRENSSNMFFEFSGEQAAIIRSAPNNAYVRVYVQLTPSTTWIAPWGAPNNAFGSCTLLSALTKADIPPYYEGIYEDPGSNTDPLIGFPYFFRFNRSAVPNSALTLLFFQGLGTHGIYLYAPNTWTPPEPSPTTPFELSGNASTTRAFSDQAFINSLDSMPDEFQLRITLSGTLDWGCSLEITFGGGHSWTSAGGAASPVIVTLGQLRAVSGFSSFANNPISIDSNVIVLAGGNPPARNIESVDLLHIGQ